MTTLLQMRSQIKDDLDLNEETWVEDSDIDRWINQGIRKAEAEIHTMYEDYFLTVTDPPVATVLNSNTIDYPADIYANKIRKIIYNDGLNGSTSSHEVRRVRNLTAAQERDIFDNDSTNPILQWSPTNDATAGRKIRLFPKIGRSGYLYIWYLRNAKQLVLDADICDIDEFARYIIQAAKTEVYLKDGDIRADDSKVLEEQYKKDMNNTLSNMVADKDDTVDMDFSFYEDMVGGDDDGII